MVSRRREAFTETERKRIGRRIGLAADLAGLSITDLAVGTGQNPSSMSRVVSGHRPFGDDLLGRVAYATGVSVETLLSSSKVVERDSEPGWVPGQCAARSVLSHHMGSGSMQINLTCDIKLHPERDRHAGLHHHPTPDSEGLMWLTPAAFTAALIDAVVTEAVLSRGAEVRAVLDALPYILPEG